MSILNILKQINRGISQADVVTPPVTTDFNNAIIICDGNSITYGAGYGAGFTYPQVLKKLDPWLENGSTVYNFGVNSQTTANMIADAATQIDVLYNPSVFNCVIAWEIGNDIGSPGAETPRKAVDRFKAYCLDRKAAGFKVLVVNVTLRALSLYTSATIEEENAYNAQLDICNAILDDEWQDFADGLVDIRHDPRMADPHNLTYYHEGVHPNGWGRVICAELINDVLKTL